MTDHLTDELFHSALSTAPRIRFPIGRLVVDPERFPDDANEPMSRVDMGVIYERTSLGLLLRHPPTPSERQNLLLDQAQDRPDLRWNRPISHTTKSGRSIG